jgi:oligoendopeptidase F
VSNRLHLAEQATQDLADQLNIVRGELAIEHRATLIREEEILIMNFRNEELVRQRDTAVQSYASLLRATELRDEEIAGLHAKIQKLLEEHSVVLEERIAESREKGARVIELLGEKVAALEEQTRLRARVGDLELELAAAKRARR